MKKQQNKIRNNSRQTTALFVFIAFTIIYISVRYLLCEARLFLPPKLTVPQTDQQIINQTFENNIYLKNYQLLKNRDKYNLLFIGDSIFNTAIIPEYFDKELRNNGIFVSSFNFSRDALSPLEMYQVAKDIIKVDFPNLRWVLLSPPVGENIYFLKALSQYNRYIFAYTPSIAWNLMIAWIRSDENWHDKISAVYRIGVNLLENIIGKGQFFDLMQSHQLSFNQQEERLFSERPIVKNRGYQPFDELVRRKDFELYQVFSQEKKEYLAIKDWLIYRHVTNEQYDLEVFIDTIKVFLDHNIIPIVVIPPRVYREDYFLEAARFGRLFNVIILNQPENYQELYDFSFRINKEHLNQQGARYLSVLLAQKFGQYLEKAKTASCCHML